MRWGKGLKDLDALAGIWNRKQSWDVDLSLGARVSQAALTPNTLLSLTLAVLLTSDRTVILTATQDLLGFNLGPLPTCCCLSVVFLHLLCPSVLTWPHAWDYCPWEGERETGKSMWPPAMS